MKQTSFLKWVMLCLLLLLSPHGLIAKNQFKHRRSEKLFNKALAAYQSNEPFRAIKLLERSLATDSLNLNAYRLLSDLADEINNQQQKIQALSKLIQLDEKVERKAFVSLALSYQQNGDFAKAMQVWEQLLGHDPSDATTLAAIEKCRKLNSLIENPLPVNFVPLNKNINTAAHEYWPQISADDSVLYFTRLLQHEQQYSYERIFWSNWNGVDWTEPLQLNMGNDELINEGTMSMTADGRLIFVSACGRPGGYGSCDLYYFIQQSGKWQGPFNAGADINTKFWEAQPSVSANGRQLYFSSNRPGGLGARDLWMSHITKQEGGKLKFSTPMNLGDHVNTPVNDYSPFIHADDQTLYFASEGHLNFGKSDVFVARFINERWTNVENPGVPLNSTAADDGLVVSPTGRVAFLSSDRLSSSGNSKDLYQFNLPESIKPMRVAYLRGYVYNALTREPMAAILRLIDLDEQSTNIVEAGSNDGFLTTLKANKNYALHIEQTGFLLYSKNINLNIPGNFREATLLEIYLQPIQPELRLILSNVFFDFDSSVPDPASKPELDELIRFLKLNPGLNVELSGHTDNQGNITYNKSLSLKRAEAIAVYLMNEIAASRIVVAGYGPDQPIAPNDTEAGREKNRRCELRILGQ